MKSPLPELAVLFLPSYRSSHCLRARALLSLLTTPIDDDHAISTPTLSSPPSPTAASIRIAVDAQHTTPPAQIFLSYSPPTQLFSSQHARIGRWEKGEATIRLPLHRGSRVE